MYREYLDVAAKHRMAALMGGLDYRASPDWGALLRYSAAGLAEANLRSLAFLRDLAAEYATALPAVLVQGFVGPRGDAYHLNRTITEIEAEDYHAVQLATLRQARVDLAWAFTINNVPEAVGIARAAAAMGVPLAISFIVESGGRLKSGPRLADAITTIDAVTNASPAFYSINCAHPEEFEPALEPGPWIHRIRGLRPNASRMEKVALCQLGHLADLHGWYWVPPRGGGLDVSANSLGCPLASEALTTAKKGSREHTGVCRRPGRARPLLPPADSTGLRRL